MSRSRLMFATVLAAAVLASLPPPAAAQDAAAPSSAAPGGKQPMSNDASNIDASSTHTAWAPGLPIPPVDEDAPPLSFLDAARKAVAAGRTGEAQEALERAESRALDRSVKPSTAGRPSGQKLVNQIAEARHSLGAGDRMRSVTLIEQAMRNPEASEAAR